MKRTDFRPKKEYPPYPKGKREVHKVLEEYEHRTLKSHGRKVKSRKQAVAIALSEQRKAEE